MKIFVVNLPASTERSASIRKQLAPLGVDYQFFPALDQAIVIMEDDAQLRPNFTQALVETRELIDQYGFIRLEADGPGRCIKKLPVQLAGPFTLFYYTRYPFGAMCYAVSPPVAAAFISVGEVVTAPVDLLIKRFWRHRQPLFGLSTRNAPIRK